MIVRFFHQMGSPRYFYNVAGKLTPWFMGGFLITLLVGLYYSFAAPPDYQQGESYRIMYIHVPAAWMSMFIYVVMAVSGLISLVWRIKMTEVIVISSAAVGASFTFLALATGSLWGKPMWGTWWVWDARLTAELLLLFLYLGIIALHSAIEDKRVAARAVSILALVGVVNIPIIHYSVEWWNTLHQPASITKFDKPSMDISMLMPLLIMAISFKLYYGAVVLMRARAEIVERERNARWVQEMVQEEAK
jgi:heme exporter protein C